MSLAPWLAVGALLVGCSERRPALRSCDDDLRGTYVVDGRRWMVLDHRDTLEAYPLFDDVAGAPGRADGLEVAPRSLDLARGPGGLDGAMRRRYLRGTTECTARAPAHVVSCTGDTVEIVRADPVPPTGFAPCTWPRLDSSRRERWRRE
ncbi:MAG: hypothetical protein ACTHU0_26870 [Kofleriaceae bacterium]